MRSVLATRAAYRRLHTYRRMGEPGNHRSATAEAAWQVEIYEHIDGRAWLQGRDYADAWVSGDGACKGR